MLFFIVVVGGGVIFNICMVFCVIKNLEFGKEKRNQRFKSKRF